MTTVSEDRNAMWWQTLVQRNPVPRSKTLWNKGKSLKSATECGVAADFPFVNGQCYFSERSLPLKTVDAISQNGPCRWKQLMPFLRTVLAVENSWCHFSERSLPLKTVDAITQNGPCRWKQLMPFLRTVLAVENSWCHFSERSLPLKTVDAISQNGPCRWKQLMPFLRTVLAVENSWCHFSEWRWKQFAISQNGPCRWKQLMPFLRTVLAVENSWCHYSERSLPLKTVAISQNGPCRWKQLMPFLRTVLAVENSWCHFSERSLPLKTVDAISQNGPCRWKQLMPFLRTVLAVENSWCHFSERSLPLKTPTFRALAIKNRKSLENVVNLKSQKFFIWLTLISLNNQNVYFCYISPLSEENKCFLRLKRFCKVPQSTRWQSFLEEPHWIWCFQNWQDCRYNCKIKTFCFSSYSFDCLILPTDYLFGSGL